ncbi:helix-turn-helix domain-containing protein [Streptomyces sp. NPDC051987]|uniref:helix-turn-helix domain-containing protein n=1 Tax=Streptomyces sp. NPDC051987 TaxID=3155808 RepID=UPI003428AE20
MSARDPEPCDGVNGDHHGEVRFYRTGWKCIAHAPRPQPLGLPEPPPYYKRPKLTPAQRDQIRRRLVDGELARDLAVEFGVTVGTIRNHS